MAHVAFTILHLATGARHHHSQKVVEAALHGIFPQVRLRSIC